MNLKPLDPVWEDYKITADSLVVIKRAVKTAQSAHRLRLLQRTFLAAEQPDLLTEVFKDEQLAELAKKVDKAVISATAQMEDLFVVKLWATFERFFRTYLQNKGTVLRTIIPSDLGEAIYDHFRGEVEYWKPDEILDFLKLTVLRGNEHLAGDAKNIYRYRSEIVHDKPSAEKIYPNFAHARLADIISILLRHLP